jgi:antitoxin ParD1/3/4
METIHVSVPQSVKEFIDSQIGEHGYSSADEYLCALVREDQKRKADDDLERLLLEGLDSGPPIEATSEYWAEKRARLLGRHRQG